MRLVEMRDNHAVIFRVFRSSDQSILPVIFSGESNFNRKLGGVFIGRALRINKLVKHWKQNGLTMWKITCLTKTNLCKTDTQVSQNAVGRATNYEKVTAKRQH